MSPQSQPLQAALCERLAQAKSLGDGYTIAPSLDGFLAQLRDPKTIGFIDGGNVTVVELGRDSQPLTSPIVVLTDEPLPTAVGWLGHCGWVAHVIASAMLDSAIIDEHLENVIRTLASSRKPRLLDWYGPSIDGRRIRLTHANRRDARIDKMTEFFTEKNVGSRTIQLLRDGAEELLTNAFYNAPVAAGIISQAVSRTQDVTLPSDSACDLAYGCRDDLAIVRVRDPFGSLSRARLVEVLNRCAQSNMQVRVDETMGGAGLGMWRIFSGATFVAVSVIKGVQTEIMVGVAKRAAAKARPFAFHLYFRDAEKKRFWQVARDDTSKMLVNHSVMIAAKSK